MRRDLNHVARAEDVGDDGVLALLARVSERPQRRLAAAHNDVSASE